MLSPYLAYSERLRDGRKDKIRIADRGQRNKEPRFDVVRHHLRNPDRDSGFPGAAWSCDRHQPHIGPAQKAANRFGFRLAPEERRQWAREPLFAAAQVLDRADRHRGWLPVRIR
jgi:hypothetical protein